MVCAVFACATTAWGEPRTPILRFGASSPAGGHSAATPPPPVRAPIGHQIVPAELQEIPATRPSDPIDLKSDQAWAWEYEPAGGSGGERENALYLGGRCSITQGRLKLSANEMVVLQDPSPTEGEQRYFVYMEGDVVIERPQARDPHAFASITLVTTVDPVISKKNLTYASMGEREIFKRAIASRHRERNALQLAQFTSPSGSAGGPGTLAAPGFALPGPGGAGSSQIPLLIGPGQQQHVTINPRTIGQDPVIRGGINPNTAPPEYVVTVTRGVNIVVDNVPINAGGQKILTRIDLTADRAVIWTDANRLDAIGAGFDVDENTPFQVYLEGNIVIRQGTNVVQASNAFYDIRERRGLFMNADVRTYVPEFDATLRVRADTLRQSSENRFHAQNAFVTTSEFGQPGYRIQASDIFVDNEPNPFTGQQKAPYITAVQPRAYIENVPVLGLPYIAGPADESLIPIRRATVGSNSINGASIETLWNLPTLLGLDLNDGVDLNLELDGYTKRGPAIGGILEYDQPINVFGTPSRIHGEGRVRYIHDEGLDNLGLDRRALTFPNANRGKADWIQRIETPFGTSLTTEIGYILNNDRNFRESWYENDYDTAKDHETMAQLAHQVDNLTASVMVRDRINNIFDQTSWLPKADLTYLGQPLLGDYLNWSSHSSVGYGHIQPAQPPTNPSDVFTPLPYFPNVQGLVAMSRHELSMPFNVGPAKVVPYALGEAAYWEEGMTGDSVERFYGSLGLRASIEFWKAFPQIQSRVLGLNGLAHKMVFDVDYSYSQASSGIGSIAQYNEFDEDAQERFRERMVIDSFGGTLPAYANPRGYAIRSGLQRSVTAMAPELVDDMHVATFGWRHRWQTKVGSPAGPRTKDWMTLDLEMSVFPNANRDNFGQTLGLISGQYAWYVGERTSIQANGIFDPFAGGQRVWNVGVLSQRSNRGSVYVGFRQIDIAQVRTQLLVGSLSYRMSDKWVSTVGSSFDVAEGIDRGQSATLTRIGEYMLIHIGMGYDRSRNNFGVGISVEPKFGSFAPGSTQLSSLLGIQSY